MVNTSNIIINILCNGSLVDSLPEIVNDGIFSNFNIAGHRWRETKVIDNSICLSLVEQSKKHKRHPVVSKPYKNKASTLCSKSFLCGIERQADFKIENPLSFQLNITQKELVTYMPWGSVGTCHGPDSTCSGCLCLRCNCETLDLTAVKKLFEKELREVLAMLDPYPKHGLNFLAQPWPCIVTRCFSGGHEDSGWLLFPLLGKILTFTNWLDFLAWPGPPSLL